MQANPKVTVLMPVFNAEKYVRDSIKSILDQTFKDFVFLIINDGSDDRSEELILSYKDPRIKYLKNEHNLGVTETLNRGIKIADTEYIARMDADDMSLPGRLGCQVNFMDKNPDVGVMGGYVRLLDEPREIWKTPVRHAEILATLPFVNPFSHPTVIIRTRVLKENNFFFNKEYLHMEDYELWYRMRKCTQYANIGKIFLAYRYSGQNITTRERGAKENSMRNFYKRLLNEMDIICANSEEHIHFDMVHKILRNPVQKHLEKMMKWLLLLAETNRKGRYFPVSEFENKLFKYWKVFYYRIILDIKSRELAEYFFELSEKLFFSKGNLALLRLTDVKNKIIHPL